MSLVIDSNLEYLQNILHISKVTFEEKYANMSVDEILEAEAAQGNQQAIELAQELSNEYTIVGISNAKFLKSCNNNRFRAELKANEHFVKLVNILSGATIKQVSQVIDDADLFKIVFTPGYLMADSIPISNIDSYSLHLLSFKCFGGVYYNQSSNYYSVDISFGFKNNVFFLLKNNEINNMFSDISFSFDSDSHSIIVNFSFVSNNIYAKAQYSIY